MTAAQFSVSFSQLPAAKKHRKRGSCDVIEVLLFFVTTLTILLNHNAKGQPSRNRFLVSSILSKNEQKNQLYYYNTSV